MEKELDEKEKELIVTAPNKAHELDVAPGCMAVELPCGYIKDGVVHSVAIVREMTGYEEDILAAKGPIVQRLARIIENCMVSIGNLSERRDIAAAVSELTGNDRLALIIAIRRLSLGDYYDPKVVCPGCGSTHTQSLNLSQVEIVPMKNRMLREREDILSSGKIITWHVLKTDDEEWLQSIRKKYKEDVLTLALLARVDVVGEEKLDRVKKFKDSIACLKKLGIKDRGEIRKLFSEEEGSVDIEVDFQCPDCEREWKADMDVGQSSFFFPSAS